MTNAASTRTDNQMCERLKKKYTPRAKAAFDSSKKNVLLKKAKESFDPFEMYDEIGENVKNESVARETSNVRQKPTKQTAKRRSLTVKKASKPLPRKRENPLASFFKNKADGDAIAVKAPSIPFGFILSLIILGTLLMMIIFSYSRISGYQSEISKLKTEKNQLSADISSIAIEIEKRDDIRVIENLAADDIGMVKGDTIEKKFITISGGEKIEVIENTDDNETLDGGFFSNLLSALTSGFSRLSEYFN